MVTDGKTVCLSAVAKSRYRAIRWILGLAALDQE
jgi:hypothetical protein